MWDDPPRETLLRSEMVYCIRVLAHLEMDELSEYSNELRDVMTRYGCTMQEMR